jgi:hypothetical protein
VSFISADGLRPDPSQGRDWLARELAHPEYHRQSLLERIRDWLLDFFDSAANAASSASPLATFAAILLAIAVIGLVVFVLPRVRRTPATRERNPAVLAGSDVTAAELRVRAEQALRDGRPEDAVADAYRALATRMVERRAIEQTVGSTAHELADRMAVRFPEQAERIVRSADLFDGVVYGEHRAGPHDAELVLRLDDDLRLVRPVDDARLTRSALAVPR